MDVEIKLMNFDETPEERKIRERNALRKRILILGATLTLTIIARLIVKNPPPPTPVAIRPEQIRYIPGMLDAIPMSQRSAIDPRVLARMTEADENSRKNKTREAETMLAQGGPYQPAQPAVDTDLEGLKYKQQLASYMRKRRMQNEKWGEPIDTSKSILVRFNNGGFIRAEKANADPTGVEIRINRGTLARVPNNLVRSITGDALTWEEPVPSGFTRLKPAKGITITVSDEAAKRITMPKDSFDDI